jgi:lysophospholipase L1-like esterase
MDLPDKRPMLAHLKSSDGNWATRDDVWIRYVTEDQTKIGGLTIGFTGYQNDQHHFGPELQFGNVVGDAFAEPVLLIKTAWGGKSLFKDFRPPRSGGEVGPYYRLMLDQVQAGIANAKTDFPALQDYQLEISGFVWQQGWNDMIDQTATREYEQNLLNLIADVREALGKPQLPFVIGELGNGGENVDENMKRFRAAQAKVASHGDPNVAFVKTASFARPAEDSPNPTHGHHWFGNAESYFLVGDAVGYAMLKLVAPERLPHVLILGDSISMGYTPFVQEQLTHYYVVRPTNAQGKMINCQGTTFGVKQIENWLAADGGKWDLIHFNFGLHDLKHVDSTGKNSMNPSDPVQASPEVYEQQLREIVEKLKSTGAKLIFATTTPVPEGAQPLRETDAPVRYNAIAKKIMADNNIPVNDLFEFALARLDEIQLPKNVHFSPSGSQVLGAEVARLIRENLESSDHSR